MSYSGCHWSSSTSAGSPRSGGQWSKTTRVTPAFLAAFVLAGCGWDDPNTLTVATAWPAAERAKVEVSFRKSAGPGVHIRWLLLSPSDDPARLVNRRSPPDVLLGGPSATFARLDQTGAFEPLDEDGPSWRDLRRGMVGLAQGPQPNSALVTTFDDPRRDPFSLTWVKAVGGASSYAEHVRDAGGPRPPGRQTGASLSAVERGEVATTPAVLPRDDLGVSVKGPVHYGIIQLGVHWSEGVAVVAGTSRPELARAFVTCAESPATEGPAPAPITPDGDALLADLIGATAVDAHDELRDAWAQLKSAWKAGRHGAYRRAERWLTDPPPWPPASVNKLLASDSNAMPMVETLAVQLAPDADVRAWLIRSWLAPPRPVDGALLDELAKAANGRLVHEPRFRAWLRSEWTAWARQRYRRVARLAAKEDAA